MENTQRELPRASESESNGRDFMQLLKDMVHHERAKDLELIRTLKEGMLFLRADIINKQGTIDSLLKQVDRLTLTVNCNCNCQQINNNDITNITDITSFSDVSVDDVIHCSDVSTVGDQEDVGHDHDVQSGYDVSSNHDDRDDELDGIHNNSKETPSFEITSRATSISHSTSIQEHPEIGEQGDTDLGDNFGHNTSQQTYNGDSNNGQLYSRDNSVHQRYKKPDEVFV